MEGIEVISLVLITSGLMITAEKFFRGRSWPPVSGWWKRAFLLNVAQAGIIFITGSLLKLWISQYSIWNLESLGSVGGGIVGYLVLTFVYYWWHRARHEMGFLWRWFHQVHHSPQRLEIITSFYKHPLEIAANSVISSIFLYLILGITPEAAAFTALISGWAELFYHWNVKTPYWIGFFFQRPESHCVHHQQGVHHYNYSDLPLWDMIFDTFHNPKTFDQACGFADDREHCLSEMLLGTDIFVLKPKGAVLSKKQDEVRG